MDDELNTLADKLINYKPSRYRCPLRNGENCAPVAPKPLPPCAKPPSASGNWSKALKDGQAQSRYANSALPYWKLDVMNWNMTK